MLDVHLLRQVPRTSLQNMHEGPRDAPLPRFLNPRLLSPAPHCFDVVLQVKKAKAHMLGPGSPSGVVSSVVCRMVSFPRVVRLARSCVLATFPPSAGVFAERLGLLFPGVRR